MELSTVLAELRTMDRAAEPAALPTEEDVDAAEARLGVRFHPDLRRFLLEASHVSYGFLEPVQLGPGRGHRDLEQVVRDAWGWDLFPAGLLPICCDNGDYYAMTPDGRVVFWTSNGATDEAWPDLASWIDQVWIKESQAIEREA